MIFKLLGVVHERVTYEIDRARRILPTAMRFGLSQLEDKIQLWRHEFEHWRGACDHTATHAKPKARRRRKKSPTARPAPSRRKRP